MSLWHNLKGMRAAAREAEKAKKPVFRIRKNGHGEFWAEECETHNYTIGGGSYNCWRIVLATRTHSFEETEIRMLQIMEYRVKTADKQIVAEYFYGPSNCA